MNKSLKDKIKKTIKGKVLFDEPMKLHTSFKIGGPAEAWVEPEDLDSLTRLIGIIDAEKISRLTIGAGSNILVRDEGFRGIVISLSSDYFKTVNTENCRIKASAGLKTAKFLKVMAERGLWGLEFMSAIPGTVGGAVMMNAGAKGKTIADLINRVEVMDETGRIFRLEKRKINFGYRFSGLDGYIILNAYFNLKKRPRDLINKDINRYARSKKDSQELDLPNAGSIFKNPSAISYTSAKLIELSGLKGKNMGDAQVSLKHANFIVNLNKARAKDVIGLIRLIRTRVKMDHGINLELEIKIV
ncbi:MAG: UDP-N-acetylmuramate dehydrogenase [Candidatus Omnitrophota bacterium]|nr:UDP-N-acetylmuramate dehydrogenase [Candidatus Omnitrophota bacterium]